MVARFIRFFFARIYDRATVRSFVLSLSPTRSCLFLSLSLSLTLLFRFLAEAAAAACR